MVAHDAERGGEEGHEKRASSLEDVYITLLPAIGVLHQPRPLTSTSHGFKAIPCSPFVGKEAIRPSKGLELSPEEGSTHDAQTSDLRSWSAPRLFIPVSLMSERK